MRLHQEWNHVYGIYRWCAQPVNHNGLQNLGGITFTPEQLQNIVDACIGTRVVQARLDDSASNVQVCVPGTVSEHTTFKRVLNDVLRANRDTWTDDVRVPEAMRQALLIACIQSYFDEPLYPTAMWKLLKKQKLWWNYLGNMHDQWEAEREEAVPPPPEDYQRILTEQVALLRASVCDHRVHKIMAAPAAKRRNKKTGPPAAEALVRGVLPPC